MKKKKGKCVTTKQLGASSLNLRNGAVFRSAVAVISLSMATGTNRGRRVLLDTEASVQIGKALGLDCKGKAEQQTAPTQVEQKRFWDSERIRKAKAYEGTKSVVGTRTEEAASMWAEAVTQSTKFGTNLKLLMKEPTKFTKIVNSLKSLGKSYTNNELVREILKCVPKNWEVKVTAIIEAKNLTTLGLDELMGFLMTREIIMKGYENDEDKKKNGIAFKASSHEEEDTNSSEDDEFSMFARKFKRLFKKNNHGKRRPFKIDFNIEDIPKKEPIICYEFQHFGHIKVDCPKLKKHEKDHKMNKKAMIAAWGQSDDSSSDEAENDEVANLCLMALGDEETTQNKVTFDYEELESAFKELHDEFRKVCAKNNVVKKLATSLSNNVDELKKENIVLKNDFINVTNEKNVLKSSVDDLNKTLGNFVK
ncbi:uncharacterized protein LOC114316803 [Camellia sinensis]|uniref:uncharacterized protein LOC114316803 n=1 Tax=Camellia sinensis TaxID=4442 RepID=UPI0010361072|nr:uncharacterized protein LOC114316803 [Camellia sinensis]